MPASFASTQLESQTPRFGNLEASVRSNLEASVRSPAGRSMGSMCSGDLIEAGLNEGAAGFARDYGDCIFARWRMPSLGVAVNGT